MKMNIRFLMVCLSLCGVLIGCAPTTPTTPALFPLPTVSTPPATPTLAPTIPDICAETGNTYRLATNSSTRYAPASVDSTDIPPSALALVASPDGNYSVVRVVDSLYLRPQNGGDDIYLMTVPYEEFVMQENIFWSHDSQHIAVIDGEIYFTNALNIRVYDLTGESWSLEAGLNDPGSFIGWSPDDRYLLTMPTLDTTNIWDWEARERVLEFSDVEGQLAWSPDGNYIAHFWSNGYDITALDGSSTRVEWDVQSAYHDSAVEHSLLWSPDSQHLMIFYIESFTAALFRGLKVVQADGEEVLNLSRNISDKNGNLLNLPIDWSQDSDAVLMWELQEDAHYRLQSYPLTGDEPETLLADVLRLPYDAPVGERTALYDRQNEIYSITLMDTNGENSVPFITDATDAGDPDWSPDGQLVAAVWATGDEAERQVRLSWVNAAGENRHDITGDYLDIRNLVWSPETQHLVYIGVTLELEYRVELADLNTGEHQVLRDGLSGVEYIQYDAAQGLFTFMWYTHDGAFGYAGYDTEGQLAFAYLESHRFRQFPSPDGQTVAIKGVTPTGETLLLATDNGETQYILGSHLDGLGDPVWSPDSQMVMFTQWIEPGQTTVHVYTVEGEKVWSSEYSWAWSWLAWEAC
jgi:hypothetical protein